VIARIDTSRVLAVLRVGGFLLGVALVFVPSFSPAAEPDECQPRAACYGIQTFAPSLSTSQAGAHPDLTISAGLKQDLQSTPDAFGLLAPYAATRDFRFQLPPGLLANLRDFGPSQRCATAELMAYSSGGGCSNASQVGTIAVSVYELGSFVEPVYLLAPPGGEVLARAGFVAGVYPMFVDFRVRSEGDYGIEAEIADVPANAGLVHATVTIWGVPADPGHDTERCTAEEAFAGCTISQRRPPGVTPLPFLTSPTRCGAPLTVVATVASWELPDHPSQARAQLPSIRGCDRIPFAPFVTATPTSSAAAAETGLQLTYSLPAAGGDNGLEPAELRELRLRLPVGMVLSPGGAHGLLACSPAEAGLGRREESHCPAAARLGEVEFDVPALERPIHGAVYLREPELGSPYGVWILADDVGLHAKLLGRLHADPETGQIEMALESLPQIPVRKITVRLNVGGHTPLVNPPACGLYNSHWEAVPWSENSSQAGGAVLRVDGACAGLRFDPGFSGGTTVSVAGASSPFELNLTRRNGEENLFGLSLTLPPGLSADFGSVPLCSESLARTGSCPAGSRVGSASVAAGSGPAPLWIPQPAAPPPAVYLAGPYEGAPFSFVVVVPARAGPFDLGTIVTRAAVRVDPTTAQATIALDSLPQILQGVPIDYRALRLTIDRPGFIRNPTNCEAMTLRAAVASAQGSVAPVSNRFQVADCGSLSFKPRVSVRLIGPTHRGAHPRLRTVLMPRPGDANVRRVAVTLPGTELFDSRHIGIICTGAEFAAGQCPAGSAYGYAKAWSPQLDRPLEGPVYFRESKTKLPALAVSMSGQVDLNLVGRVDSVRGRLRTTLRSLPDVPLSRVMLTMQGGKQGLFVNTGHVCSREPRSGARFEGQNESTHDVNPPVRTDCGNRSQ
jgi:hypothetical protein